MVQRTVVVTLCGPRRCGKDTVADHLATEHTFTNVKVAGKLKDTVKSLFGLTDDEVEGSVKDAIHPRLGVSPRRLLQWLGTDVMQYAVQDVLPGVGRNFWIDGLVQEIQQKHAGGRVVISDVRFQHEVDALRRAFPDMLLVRIVRDTTPNSDTETDQHTSEVEAASLTSDTVLYNSGSVNELRREATKLITRDPIVSLSRTRGTVAWHEC
jgi:hypothetical protein